MFAQRAGGNRVTTITIIIRTARTGIKTVYGFRGRRRTHDARGCRGRTGSTVAPVVAAPGRGHVGDDGAPSFRVFVGACFINIAVTARHNNEIITINNDISHNSRRVIFFFFFYDYAYVIYAYDILTYRVILITIHGHRVGAGNNESPDKRHRRRF